MFGGKDEIITVEWTNNNIVRRGCCDVLSCSVDRLIGHKHTIMRHNALGQDVVKRFPYRNGWEARERESRTKRDVL